jgi:hypothetical protein
MLHSRPHTWAFVTVSFTVVILIGVLTTAVNAVPNVNAFSQSNSATSKNPTVENFVLNATQGQSTTILVPVDNLGSSLNWTDMRLTFVEPFKGIQVSTDPLLFVDSIVLSHSDNYSLRIGISVSKNTSLGVYSIPFSLTGRSSFYPPAVSLSIGFNVTVTVLKSPRMTFPPVLLFPPFILISALITIGIVIIWGRDWNISEVKK